jgi:glycosyltransferase involved in cell wall biosynthesis
MVQKQQLDKKKERITSINFRILIIGINARNILGSKMEGFGNYSYELVRRITKNHPEQTFVLFFDRAVDPKFEFTPNVKTVVLFPPTRHPLLWILWFEWSLKRAIKKHRIDLLWSPDGFCSLGAEVSQIATIHDLNFEHYPKDLPWLVSIYFRAFFPKFARKAKHILTVSNFSKKDIVEKYGVSNNKISVVYNGISEEYRILTSDEISETRRQYSNGKPYFIFVGSLHPRKNVQRLVQAFSAFSMTNSEIDLVIVGNAMWKQEEFNLTSETKKRVHFLGHLSTIELSRITGAAYALSYVPYFEGFGIPLVEAMRCGVPIISANTSCLPEIADDAAIYCDPFSVNDITEKMSQLADDSALHSSLSEKALDRSSQFSWDLAANQVWEVLAQK